MRNIFATFALFLFGAVAFAGCALDGTEATGPEPKLGDQSEEDYGYCEGPWDCAIEQDCNNEGRCVPRQ